jgi:hypothetical protein
MVELLSHGSAPLLDHGFPVLPTLCSLVFHSLLKFVCKQCKLFHELTLRFPLGALFVLGLDGRMASGNEIGGVVGHMVLLSMRFR